MNEEILEQINTILRNAGYEGTATYTDNNADTVTISGFPFISSTGTSTIQLTEPSTIPPTEPPTTTPTEPPTEPPAEPSAEPSAELTSLEFIIEQQNERIAELTNKLNEIFKISPSAQPKNEWESYLDDPNSATYRAMKEAGLIKENNHA